MGCHIMQFIAPSIHPGNHYSVKWISNGPQSNKHKTKFVGLFSLFSTRIENAHALKLKLTYRYVHTYVLRSVGSWPQYWYLACTIRSIGTYLRTTPGGLPAPYVRYILVLQNPLRPEHFRLR
jgi:hypothetical protein